MERFVSPGPAQASSVSEGTGSGKRPERGPDAGHDRRPVAAPILAEQAHGRAPFFEARRVVDG
ncbi:hypothetical protein, partial [Azospirillum sp. B506]|uniref:hypothetical protein n=1 Tax=Azospirillum sp. B506 TaxID=137721 RepID=UPI0005B2CC45